MLPVELSERQRQVSESNSRSAASLADNKSTRQCPRDILNLFVARLGYRGRILHTSIDYGGRALSEKDREKFAKIVADYIEQGRLHQRYQRLRFTVEPKFLGMLHARLSEETRHLIFEEINEDLSALDAREIQAHLQRH
ncbi:MAG TPA: host attachment protein [Trinickia sp.]|uniref:host attachment protein n=1 Tax=Trinickia sp. TaxID=2571163 RepID=UPI002C3A450F|nr:host attachment protein [Trinickia sp.]HVW53778.1 host attachment protein [Trinickia sp.]